MSPGFFPFDDATEMFPLLRRVFLLGTDIGAFLFFFVRESMIVGKLFSPPPLRPSCLESGACFPSAQGACDMEVLAPNERGLQFSATLPPLFLGCHPFSPV